MGHWVQEAQIKYIELTNKNARIEPGIFDWASFCLWQGDGARTAVHAYCSLVVASSIAVIDGACTACAMGSSHNTAYQPIAATFSTQGGGNVLAVGYTVAGHAAAARNQKDIVGAHSRGGIACNHLNGTCSSTVAAHIGRGGNGDVAGAVDNRIGAIQGVTATDAAGNRIVVNKIIVESYAEVTACGSASAGVADYYNTTTETAIATQTIGGAIIDGNGSWRGGGIAYYCCTSGKRKAFRTVVEIRFVNNVFIYAQQGFKLRRFGSLILFFGSFYLVFFLARHRKQANA